MRCALCQASFPEFQPAGICPECGSHAEDRMQFLFLERMPALQAGTKVLSVGARATELTAFQRHFKEARITALDIRPKAYHKLVKPPHRTLVMDVAHLSFSDQCFDLILCLGILPFVRSDYLAMSELHRCLKGEGVAFVNASVTLPKSRRASELHGENPGKYSQRYLREKGDEWVYGADYFERLEAAGFFFHRLRADAWMPENVRAEQQVENELELILCFKYKDAREKFLKEAGLG